MAIELDMTGIYLTLLESILIQLSVIQPTEGSTEPWDLRPQRQHRWHSRRATFQFFGKELATTEQQNMEILVKIQTRSQDIDNDQR